MARWIASVSLMFGLIGAVPLLMGWRNPVVVLWDPIACGIVGFGTLVYLIAAFGPGEIRGAVNLATSRRPAADEEWIAADHLFESAMRAVVAFGAVGYVIGLITMLMRLDDPKQLGPCVAVALLSVFYAVVVGELVFGTLRMRTQRYLRSKRIGTGGSPPGPGAYVAAFIMPTLPILACFLVV